MIRPGGKEAALRHTPDRSTVSLAFIEAGRRRSRRTLLLRMGAIGGGAAATAGAVALAGSGVGGTLIRAGVAVIAPGVVAIGARVARLAGRTRLCRAVFGPGAVAAALRRFDDWALKVPKEPQPPPQ